jgi:hypothetical protein
MLGITYVQSNQLSTWLEVENGILLIILAGLVIRLDVGYRDSMEVNLPNHLLA